MELWRVCRPVYRRSLKQSCRRRLIYALSRHESSAVSADLSGDHEVDPEVKVPLVPKHRDPHAVLKALSSTLTPLPHPLLMGGRSLADPMAPRTRKWQLQYQRAHEAGRKSAQYVINRWPAMFPDVKSDPDLQPSLTLPRGVNEETLKSLIARKQTSRAMKLFQKLQEKGDPVSLETQNGLLELLAYYGLGNPRMRSGVNSESGEDVEMGEEVTGRGGEGGMVEVDQLGEELGKHGSDEATAYLAEEVVKTVELEDARNIRVDAEDERSNRDRVYLMQFHKDSGRVWSTHNQAEKLFAEMLEKDGGTYDALILGLVKFGNFDRAWEVFDEMRRGGHQASVATYNSLLFVIGNTTIPDPWSEAMSLVQQMCQEPAVQPDISTMNLLLEISALTGASSAMHSAIQLSLKTFRETLLLGLEPNLSTFLALLKAHTKSSDGSVLYDITDYLEKNQHILKITDTQDIRFFTVAMTTARNMLDHELAARLRRLCDRDNWMLCNNFTLFVSHYLVTITGRVPMETLKREYNSFVPDVVLPREWVYGIMFRACDEQDSPTFALELWNHIMRYRVEIANVDTLSRFSGALSKKVFPSEVDSVLQALMQAWDKSQQLETSPPSVMISQIIRLHCLKMDVDKAWEFFLHFEEYDRQPTFQALVSLLKAYSNVQDVEKTVEVLNLMSKYGMVLPTTFVRDMCWTAGVSAEVKHKLVSQFSRGGGRANPAAVSRDQSDIELL